MHCIVCMCMHVQLCMNCNMYHEYDILTLKSCSIHVNNLSTSHDLVKTISDGRI